MKKSLALLTSLLITLSACSSELEAPLAPELTAPPQQVQMSAVEEAQAEASVNSNKSFISNIVETIYAENFSDGVDTTELKNSIQTLKTTPVTSELQTKGGRLFNLLNKSTLAQKVAYFFVDYPVRYQFNKPGKPDSTPRINEQEIQELKSKLKPGDLILCGNNSSFIHAILYFGNDTIIHALATKVKGSQKFMGTVKETLTEYLARGERDKFVVLRYKNFDPNELSKVYDFASKQIGKSYDTLFLLNSDMRFYCTELVYKSVMQMANPPRMYPHKMKLGWQLITNEDFMDSPDFETVWEFNKQRPPVGQIHQYN